MSRKVLIITVGGSDVPIVRSIELNKPDFVYFVCSADSDGSKGSYHTIIGEGNVCGGNPNKNMPPNKKNIAIQSNLRNESFEVFKIKKFDNINDCFQVCSDIIQKTKNDKNNRIVIDYTGGTKSMSSGLVLAASNYPDIIISLVAGDRNNLVKTIDGTEQLSLFRVNKAYLNLYISRANSFLKNRDYDSVITLLENLLSTYYDIPSDISNHIKSLIIEAKGFSFWDKFQHQEAYKAFYSKQLKSKYKGYLDALRKILIARAKMDENFNIEELGLSMKIPASGYEVVYDLLLNAERKALSLNYDDAVARIYRAIEVFVQVHLKLNYEINTSDVDLNQLPDGDLKVFYENSDEDKIRLPLMKSYELLGYLNSEDPVFQLFLKFEKDLLKVLSARNYSILAHGFQSINETKYLEIKNIAVRDFLTPLMTPFFDEVKFKLRQLPNEF